MQFKTVADIQSALKGGECTLTDVVNSCLSAISERNSTVNAVISVDEERALQQAEQIQQKVDERRAGTLAGAVIGVKDLICEKGKQTTCGSAMLKGFESVYDATVIERLKSEDALLLGRLNMDEFAMGSSNENSAWGPVRNPHDPSRVPGGSSGGSAAAVAAGFCTAALGSDTGGSIRQPASYCGIVGVKPTYGRVSRHGLVAFASSFDCIGPMSHTVEDSARLLEVMAGVDRHDNTSSSRVVPRFAESVRQPDAAIRIGVPEEYFGEGLDDGIRTGIREILSALDSEGAELVPIQLPHMKYSIATYYVLANAEASSNLARFDGIRYGHRADIEEVEDELNRERDLLQKKLINAGEEEAAELAEKLEQIDSPLIRLYKKNRTEGFGPEVKRRIMLGTYVLSSGYYEAYYARAQKVRRLIQEDFTRAFEKVDVIASPTAPTTAFGLDSKVDSPLQMYLNDVYTSSANLAGICGISVPAGVHSDGLPYGMQFMANAFEEERMLNAARLVERLTDGESS